MTVFRFRITDKNEAHTRVNLFVGPDADHLALSGGLTFRTDEFPAFADAITEYNERNEPEPDDPGPSFWIDDERGPQGWGWGCEQCPGPDPVGGTEPTRGKAWLAAEAHERMAHSGVAVSR
jgi:hypothetical protein